MMGIQEKRMKVVIYVNYYCVCIIKREREIFYYENYFIDFFIALDEGVKKSAFFILDDGNIIMHIQNRKRNDRTGGRTFFSYYRCPWFKNRNSQTDSISE